MDGFDQSINVKVIMATNRADTLDPALLRPGRLDRKIEFPVPDRRQKRLVFSTVTSKMNLSDEVDLEDYVARPDHISGADINSICQEVCLAISISCFNDIFLFAFRLVCKLFEKIVILSWRKTLKKLIKMLLKRTNKILNFIDNRKTIEVYHTELILLFK